MKTDMGYRQSNSSRMLFLITALVVMVCITVTNVQKGYANTQEYDVKAAFLFNFVKFVDWPEDVFQSSTSPFIISILGTDSFGKALDSFKGKTINGRNLVIKRADSLNELERSHVIFICASERENLSQILGTAEKWHALTVGDTKGFIQSGGIINLVIIDGKIGFEINVAAAEKADLKISSKLLKLVKALYTN